MLEAGMVLLGGGHHWGIAGAGVSTSQRPAAQHGIVKEGRRIEKFNQRLVAYRVVSLTIAPRVP
jgi:hypothetical protein